MAIAEKIFKLLCSLKLAVIIIVSLLIISAWGTIVESKYDMITAQKLVYHSPYMYTVLIVLCVQLIAVMVDRLPWKKRHSGFILAHIGIIILLIGSYITRVTGIDGSLQFEIGETSKYVSLNDTDLIVYRLKDMDNSEKIFAKDVEFLVDSPKKNPLEIKFAENEFIRMVDYMPYAQKDVNVIVGDRVTDGPAIRFQLQNKFANMTEWLVQTGSSPSKINLGPLQVVLTKGNYESLGGQNEIVFTQDSKDQLTYKIVSKEKELLKKGSLKAGETIETPWMKMTLKVVQHIPKARVDFKYTKQERPLPTSTSAVLVEFKNQTYWLGKNSYIQLFTEDSVYFVTYGNKRIELGFPMTLKKFEVENYEGTQMAKSYKSLVDVPGIGEKEISMNEPLKHEGFTFYQSSFEKDKMGEPIASVLTVNHDPGRWMKYVGCLLIVLGSIILFYFKKFGKADLKQKVEFEA